MKSSRLFPMIMNQLTRECNLLRRHSVMDGPQVLLEEDSAQTRSETDFIQLCFGLERWTSEDYFPIHLCTFITLLWYGY